jgi:hypothetical protein
MERLDLLSINRHAPYIVLFDGTSYLFKTSIGVRIAVQFALEKQIKFLTGYWFGLKVITDDVKQEPIRDEKIRETIICILDEFFSKNPDYILYLCDFDDDRQASRNRMFRSWFNTYELKERYIYQDKKVKLKGKYTFVCLVVPKSHPMCEEIAGFFNEVIDIFTSNKP